MKKNKWTKLKKWTAYTMLAVMGMTGMYIVPGVTSHAAQQTEKEDATEFKDKIRQENTQRQRFK